MFTISALKPKGLSGVNHTNTIQSSSFRFSSKVDEFLKKNDAELEVQKETAAIELLTSEVFPGITGKDLCGFIVQYEQSGSYMSDRNVISRFKQHAPQALAALQTLVENGVLRKGFNSTYTTRYPNTYTLNDKYRPLVLSS